MAVYAVGDIQGCADELQLLLDTLEFNPERDKLWLVGDLVNRGPKSLETLRIVKALGNAAICVLGNHDLHLLALALTGKAQTKDDSLQPVLEADDCGELIEWLRHRPLAHFDESSNSLMVHAGVIADWSVQDVLDRAAEVEAVLRSNNPEAFLNVMYGREPDRWSDDLTSMERLRFITNCLTRIRYCTADGQLDFDHKLGLGTQPEHLVPWFDLPDRANADTRIVFGHWSTLGFLHTGHLVALDTGCVWGGTLTADRLDKEAEPVHVTSAQPKGF